MWIVSSGSSPDQRRRNPTKSLHRQRSNRRYPDASDYAALIDPQTTNFINNIGIVSVRRSNPSAACTPMRTYDTFILYSLGSLSDLKEIGCKSVWLVYISPLFRPIEQLLAFKIVKIYLHPVTFSLRFFKADRLLAASAAGADQF